MMWKKILKTDSSWAPLVLRLALGFVMFPHGAQKALGWFGGPGFSGAMGFFGSMGVPAVLAFLDIIAEFLGSIALVIGFKTRVAAAGIFVVMLVATLMVHLHNGFFMNWYGNKPGEGFEYHLLAMGIAIALMITGGGRCSIDQKLTKKWGL